MIMYNVSLVAYFLFTIIGILIFSFGSYFQGIYIIFLSLAGIYFSRSFVALVFSFLSVSLGLAFDYYLRVRLNDFGFYYGNGSTVQYLALITMLYMVWFYWLDRVSSSNGKGVVIRSFDIKISSLFYYPSFLLIVFVSFFVAKNAGSFLSSNFELSELSKYSFLEYMAFIVLLFIKSSNSVNKSRISYFVSFCFVLVLLMASYRMVAIIMMLTILFCYFNGRVLRRWPFVLLWVLSYFSLAAVSYLRYGVDDISLYNLLGYKYGGVLDNTFTGVIETALIYSSVSNGESFIGILKHLVGVLAPLPGSFIPDSWIYYVRLYEVHLGRIPGGGLLTGFFIYFNFMLLPFYMLYKAFAFYPAFFGVRNKCSLFYNMSSIFYFVVFISVARWWLYGPYVLFKFLGVAFLLFILNGILKSFVNRSICG